MNPAHRHRLALVLWSGGLAAGCVALIRIGRDHPGTPPLSRPGDWGAWAAGHDTLDVVAAVARLSATALLGYLLVLTVLQLLVSARGATRHRALVARAGPRFLAALTAAVVASSGPAGAQGAADDSISSTTVPPGLGATMELISPDRSTSLPWSDPPEVPIVEPDEWVVGPGDHLWSIAESTVREELGAEPDLHEVRDYWLQLIEANTDRLVDPEDPDLILPGQRFRLV